MDSTIVGSPQISWVLETKVKAGEWPAVEMLMAEAIEATKADPNAINYEFFADGDTLHVYEKYADSPATLAHLAWFGEKIAQRFLSIADITRFTVYGSPSDEVREVLDSMGATYQEAVGGFAR